MKRFKEKTNSWTHTIRIAEEIDTIYEKKNVNTKLKSEMQNISHQVNKNYKKIDKKKKSSSNVSFPVTPHN